MLYVKVHKNNVDKALNILKKQVKETKLMLILKEREFYRKPSEIKREKRAKARLRSKKGSDYWMFFKFVYIYIYKNTLRFFNLHVV